MYKIRDGIHTERCQLNKCTWSLNDHSFFLTTCKDFSESVIVIYHELFYEILPFVNIALDAAHRQLNLINFSDLILIVLEYYGNK